MSDTNSTRRTDEPPTRDGAPLAGWPTAITAEEAVALRGALKQLQTALDAVVRERDEARAEIERVRALLKDPNAVHINMLRGVIALPSADQIRHIYQQTLEAKP